MSVTSLTRGWAPVGNGAGVGVTEGVAAAVGTGWEAGAGTIDFKFTAPAKSFAFALTWSIAVFAFKASATVMNFCALASQSTQASVGGVILSEVFSDTQSRVLLTGKPVWTVTSAVAMR